MRSLLLGSALLATLAAAPALAAPATIVCGPFVLPIHGKPFETGQLTFVVDAAAGTAQFVEPNGAPVDATISGRTSHAVAITFSSHATLGTYDPYVLSVSNDHGAATIFNGYTNTQLAKGWCRPGQRLVF